MEINLDTLNAELKKRGFPCGNWALGLPYSGNVTVEQARHAVNDLNRDAERVRASFALKSAIRAQ